MSGARKLVPGRGYTREDWDAVSSPPVTKRQAAAAKPFAQAFPELAEKMRKTVGGRPRAARPRLAVSIRLDQDVIDKFKATGPGWQARINEALEASKI